MADRDIWDLSFEDRFRSVMDQYMDKEESCPATRGKAIGSQLDRSAKVLLFAFCIIDQGGKNFHSSLNVIEFFLSLLL